MADQTTVTESSPWAFLLPYMQQYMTGITGALENNPPSPYPGPTVAPMSQNQTTAMDMMRQLAMNSTPTALAGTSAIGDFASGAAGTQNPFMPVDNPYLQDMVSASNKDIADQFKYATMPTMSAQAARQGTWGGTGFNQASSLMAGQLGDSLAQNTANLRGNAYNLSAGLADQGLNRRLQAGQMGVGTQAADLSAIGGLFGMGQQQQQTTQAQLDALRQFWMGTQNAPYAASDILGNAISRLGGGGGSQTTTVNGPEQSFLSWLGPALGLALGIGGRIY